LASNVSPIAFLAFFIKLNGADVFYESASCANLLLFERIVVPACICWPVFKLASNPGLTESYHPLKLHAKPAAIAALDATASAVSIAAPAATW
jgi:hypothetical protein